MSKCGAAYKSRKLAANLEDIAGDPTPEGCAALENVLGVKELADEWKEEVWQQGWWSKDWEESLGPSPAKPEVP